MSVERSFEAWEEVQRHGQDLADRLAQGFTGLIHTRPPVFPCPNPHKSKLFDLEFPELHHFGARMEDLGAVLDHHGVNGVSAIIDIGSRIGQAGVELGMCLNGMMQQVFRRLPVPFKQEEGVRVAVGRVDGSKGGGLLLLGTSVQGELGLWSERLREFGFVEDGVGEGCQGSVGGGVGEGCQGSVGGGVGEGCQGSEGGGVGVADGVDDVVGGSDHLAKLQGTLNISSTYDSRNKSIESSLVAKGDLWRVEASQGSPTSGNENSPLFLVQLGPVLFIRDRTLLLPVHGSKQHLLWYGYDRKNGVHSLCPAVWSKHGRWLLMPMLCLNPFTCSFVDLQFPNGQFTYVSGEGLTTSAFVPFCGGLLQAQGQCPGEMRFSFSHKNKRGTRITPMVQWPDKSFTLGFAQALAWQRSGLMVKPTVQFSLFPTFGGSNPGVRTELIHSVNDKLNLICGCAFTEHPSLFASVSVGRSKWNGNVGSSGVVVRVDTPLSNVGRPSFSVQINSGLEF